MEVFSAIFFVQYSQMSRACYPDRYMGDSHIKTVDIQKVKESAKAGSFIIIKVIIIDRFYFKFSFFSSFILIARTLRGRPHRVMKPSASWWSYISPVVKDAKDSL